MKTNMFKKFIISIILFIIFGININTTVYGEEDSTPRDPINVCWHKEDNLIYVHDPGNGNDVGNLGWDWYCCDDDAHCCTHGKGYVTCNLSRKEEVDGFEAYKLHQLWTADNRTKLQEYFHNKDEWDSDIDMGDWNTNEANKPSTPKSSVKRVDAGSSFTVTFATTPTDVSVVNGEKISNNGNTYTIKAESGDSVVVTAKFDYNEYSADVYYYENNEHHPGDCKNTNKLQPFATLRTGTIPQSETTSLSVPIVEKGNANINCYISQIGDFKGDDVQYKNDNSYKTVSRHSKKHSWKKAHSALGEVGDKIVYTVEVENEDAGCYCKPVITVPECVKMNKITVINDKNYTADIEGGKVTKAKTFSAKNGNLPSIPSKDKDGNEIIESGQIFIYKKDDNDENTVVNYVRLKKNSTITYEFEGTIEKPVYKVKNSKFKATLGSNIWSYNKNENKMSANTNKTNLKKSDFDYFICKKYRAKVNVYVLSINDCAPKNVQYANSKDKVSKKSREDKSENWKKTYPALGETGEKIRIKIEVTNELQKDNENGDFYYKNAPYYNPKPVITQIEYTLSDNITSNVKSSPLSFKALSNGKSKTTEIAIEKTKDANNDNNDNEYENLFITDDNDGNINKITAKIKSLTNSNGVKIVSNGWLSSKKTSYDYFKCKIYNVTINTYISKVDTKSGDDVEYKNKNEKMKTSSRKEWSEDTKANNPALAEVGETVTLKTVISRKGESADGPYYSPKNVRVIYKYKLPDNAELISVKNAAIDEANRNIEVTLDTGTQKTVTTKIVINSLSSQEPLSFKTYLRKIENHADKEFLGYKQGINNTNEDDGYDVDLDKRVKACIRYNEDGTIDEYDVITNRSDKISSTDYYLCKQYNVSTDLYISNVTRNNGGATVGGEKLCTNDGYSPGSARSVIDNNTKEQNPVVIENGDKVLYKLEVKNNANNSGPYYSPQAVTVKVKLPMHLLKTSTIDNVSSSDGDITVSDSKQNITIKNLASGQTKTIDIWLTSNTDSTKANNTEEYYIRTKITEVKNHKKKALTKGEIIDNGSPRESIDYFKIKSYDVSIDKYIVSVKHNNNEFTYNTDGEIRRSVIRNYNGNTSETNDKEQYKENNRVSVEYGDEVTYDIIVYNTNDKENNNKHFETDSKNDPYYSPQYVFVNIRDILPKYSNIKYTAICSVPNDSERNVDGSKRNLIGNYSIKTGNTNGGADYVQFNKVKVCEGHYTKITVTFTMENQKADLALDKTAKFVKSNDKRITNINGFEVNNIGTKTQSIEHYLLNHYEVDVDEYVSTYNAEMAKYNNKNGFTKGESEGFTGATNSYSENGPLEVEKYETLVLTTKATNVMASGAEGDDPSNPNTCGTYNTKALPIMERTMDFKAKSHELYIVRKNSNERVNLKEGTDFTITQMDGGNGKIVYRYTISDSIILNPGDYIIYNTLIEVDKSNFYLNLLSSNSKVVSLSNINKRVVTNSNKSVNISDDNFYRMKDLVIAGSVWIDKNRDGYSNDAQSGMKNIKVKLYANTNSTANKETFTKTQENGTNQQYNQLQSDTDNTNNGGDDNSAVEGVNTVEDSNIEPNDEIDNDTNNETDNDNDNDNDDDNNNNNNNNGSDNESDASDYDNGDGGYSNINIDINGDGIADVNIDTDGDGEPDKNCLNENVYWDSDENVLVVNIDEEVNIDINNDDEPDINLDVDNDGIADYNFLIKIVVYNPKDKTFIVDMSDSTYSNHPYWRGLNKNNLPKGIAWDATNKRYIITIASLSEEDYNNLMKNDILYNVKDGSIIYNSDDESDNSSDNIRIPDVNLDIDNNGIADHNLLISGMQYDAENNLFIADMNDNGLSNHTYWSRLDKNNLPTGITWDATNKKYIITVDSLLEADYNNLLNNYILYNIYHGSNNYFDDYSDYFYWKCLNKNDLPKGIVWDNTNKCFKITYNELSSENKPTVLEACVYNYDSDIIVSSALLNMSLLSQNVSESGVYNQVDALKVGTTISKNMVLDTSILEQAQNVELTVVSSQAGITSNYEAVNQDETTLNENVGDTPKIIRTTKKGKKGEPINDSANEGVLIAETTTDENGFYVFDERQWKGLEKDQYGNYINNTAYLNYYIEFEYDGLMYQSTEIYGGTNSNNANGKGNLRGDWRLGKDNTFPGEKIGSSNYLIDSNAYEFADVRESYNNKFQTIGFNKSYIGNRGQVALSYSKNGNESKLIETTDSNRVMKARSFVNKANKNTNTLSLYSLYTETPDALETEYMKYINLGLIERNDLDLSLESDVTSVKNIVNGEEMTYEYGANNVDSSNYTGSQNDYKLDKPYDLTLYEADYKYKADSYYNTNTDVKNYKKDSSELVSQVTYKITLHNKAINNGYDIPIDAAVDEVAIYYDKNFMSLDDNGTVKRINISKKDSTTGLLKPVQTATITAYYGSVSNSNTLTISNKSLYGNVAPAGSDYNVLYLSGSKMSSTYLSEGATQDIYITFTVDDGADGYLNIAEDFDMISEISAYTTKYANSYEKASLRGKYAGFVDVDSNPGNLGLQNGTSAAKSKDVLDNKAYYEDDTYKTIIKMSTTPTSTTPPSSGESNKLQRTITGFVWDDARSNQVSEGGTGIQYLGNGTYNVNNQNNAKAKTNSKINYNADKPLQGIKVTLVEMVQTKAVNSNGDAVYYECDAKDSNGNVITTTTDENGQYTLKDYIPGYYKVRFSYGENNNDIYNGQDYKSTTYKDIQTSETLNKNLGISSNNKYFDDVKNTIKASNVSDARDDEIRRLNVNSYAEIMTADKAKNLANGTASKYTSMYADSNIFYVKPEKVNSSVVTVSGNTSNVKTTNNNADFDKNRIWELNNLDFGIEYRPETSIILDKEIDNIKLTISDGKDLVDLSFTTDASGNRVIDTKKINKGSNNVQFVPNTGKSRRGFVYLNMDEEILEGTEIKVKYSLLAENASEVDRINKNLYNIKDEIGANAYTSTYKVYSRAGTDYRYNANATAAEVLGKTYYNNYKYEDGKDTYTYLKKLKDTYNSSNTTKVGNITLSGQGYYGMYLGETYYKGTIGANDKISELKVDNILDYIDNDFAFRQSSNSATDQNWTVTSSQELLNNNLVDSSSVNTTGGYLVDKEGIAYDDEERSNLVLSTDTNRLGNNTTTGNISLSKFLKTTNAVSDNDKTSGKINLEVSKVLSVADIEGGKSLDFENIAEVIQFTTTAGRRTTLPNTNSDGGGIIGNANTKEWFGYDKYEDDTDAAELITITPPTGLKK